MLEKKSVEFVESKEPYFPSYMNREIYKAHVKEKDHKLSEDREKCADATFFQNPFYIISLLRNAKKKKNPGTETPEYYHEEALKTILSF